MIDLPWDDLAEGVGAFCMFCFLLRLLQEKFCFLYVLNLIMIFLHESIIKFILFYYDCAITSPCYHVFHVHIVFPNLVIHLKD